MALQSSLLADLNNMLTIKSGHVSDHQLRNDFISVQTGLYEHDPFKSLVISRSADFPVSATLVVAYRHAKPVGRLAILDNKHLKNKENQVSVAGFYECENNFKTAVALLNEGEAIARKNGYPQIVGPMNGDTWHKYRFTVPSGNPPFFLDNYHKPWYRDQWLLYGFRVADRYYSTCGPVGEAEQVPQSFLDRIHHDGIFVTTFHKDRFKQEILDIYHLSLESFSNNQWYTPISADDFLSLYLPVQEFIHPDFVLMARDGNGTLVGFCFTVPDVLYPDAKRLIIKSLAVKPGRASAGIGSYLVRQTYERAKERGYREMIHALMHESNHSTRIMRAGHSVYQTYELMIRVP